MGLRQGNVRMAGNVTPVLFDRALSIVDDGRMSAADLLRVIVSTADLDRAAAFYGGLLQLPRLSRQGDFARFALGDRELLLHRRPVDGGDAAVAVGFAVEDLSAVVERWRAEGGTIVDEPAAQPWGERMAVVRDPDGHLVCLSAVE